MDFDTKLQALSQWIPRRLKPKKLNPKKCDNARPYMVDNGILDMYICQKFGVNCYFEPNGGKQFKKRCEEK
jgi:hypothetical protein